MRFKTQYFSEMVKDWCDAPLHTFPTGTNKAEMERHAKKRFQASGTKIRVVPIPAERKVA